MKGAELVEAWQATIIGPKAWVLFENGTCVVPTEPEADLVAQATARLRENGPAPSSKANKVIPRDFSVITLDEGRGWVVTGWHDEIFTFVGPDEASTDTPDVVIGCTGRYKAEMDAESLRVLHVWDKRHAEPVAAPDPAT